jgi:hypothetical protein
MDRTRKAAPIIGDTLCGKKHHRVKSPALRGEIAPDRVLPAFLPFRVVLHH